MVGSDKKFIENKIQGYYWLERSKGGIRKEISCAQNYNLLNDYIPVLIFTTIILTLVCIFWYDYFRAKNSNKTKSIKFTCILHVALKKHQTLCRKQWVSLVLFIESLNLNYSCPLWSVLPDDHYFRSLLESLLWDEDFEAIFLTGSTREFNL